ncbi:MAG TPA: hypothetical protein VI485_09495 [Vicinamibacterales bacterium]|nr:hypothetical protein [Vicinamibacterales bacterium]
MTRRLALAVLLTLTLCGAVASAVAQQSLFPNTKKNGRATVEFRNDGFKVVANYDYSQRNHDTPWLLIDIAAASERRFTLHKKQITLVTPAGTVLPVAPQEALIADAAGITSLMQNSKIWRRPLAEYFSQRSRIEPLRFYAFPFGGVAFDEAVVDNDRVALGELFFRTLEEKWKEGTYRLVVDHEKAKAALPISLQ